ncbi:MAG: leucyl aminopeptidase, partial [Paracoccaceae bacterium]
MQNAPTITVIEPDLDAIATATGHIAVFVTGDGKLDKMGRRVNRLMKGALARFVESDSFAEMKEADGQVLSYPTGLAADGVVVIRLERRAKGSLARKAGSAIGKVLLKGDALVLAG